MNTNELRVFISSTFRDLQEEREHLVKKVFPEIRALCRERGITFTEVDLRWGLTDEDVALGRIIRTCLEEIDRCRPWFIGITGDRYGYVPELQEVYRDPELLARHPWIEDAVLEEASIIDLEFQHGALNREHGEGSDVGARFFFRRQRRSLEPDNGDVAGERGRLEELKRRIRGAGLPVEEFRDPVTLGEMIYDELVEIIERDFARVTPPTPLGQERSRHRAFAASRTQAYIPNAAYLRRLNDHAAGEGLPLILYAESGSGKSSLVACWAEHHRRKHPEAFMVEHYVGIGAGDTDHLGIIRHVISEIRERFHRIEEIPSKPDELERDFITWLGYVSSDMVLILDGLNQLQGHALSLSWLPTHLPSNIRLVVTSTVEETLVHLRERGWGELGMQPLSEREREAVVVRFLSEYRKALSKEQIKRVAGDQKSSHPLFLRTVLEELRLHGTHEHLESQLDYYLETTGTEDVFQRVLERLESDFGTREVREVMGLLFVSRSGLSESELADVTGFSRMKLSTLVLGLDYHLVRKDGLLGFFHDYLRRAVEKRYLSDKARRREMHLRLARYFENVLVSDSVSLKSIAARGPRELAWQLHEAGEEQQLANALATIPWFMSLYQGETAYEVLGYWAGLGGRYDMNGAYRQGLEQWRQSEPDTSETMAVLEQVAELLKVTGNWEGAIVLLHERLEESIAEGVTEIEADTRQRLGWLYEMRGEYAEAFTELERARVLYEKIGNRRGLATVIGFLGLAYSSTGKFNRGVECYREQESICREISDRRGVAGAVGQIGVIHYMRGEYDHALACLGEQEMISRELGDRGYLSVALGHTGLVYKERGELDRALECYRKQEMICTELGDRFGLSRVIGNIGIVHHERGDLDSALECYRQHREICGEIGNRHGFALATGNMGVVHCDRGEYELALEFHREQYEISSALGDEGGIGLSIGCAAVVHEYRGEQREAIESFARAMDHHRAIGYRAPLVWWLQGMARMILDITVTNNAMPEYLPAVVPGITETDWQAAALHHARGCIEEAIRISEELSKQEMLFGSRVTLARLNALGGDIVDAVQRLGSLLVDAVNDEQRAEIYYWMWRLDPPRPPSADTPPGEGFGVGAGCRVEALRLFEGLVQTTPRDLFRQRVEELQHGAARQTIQ